MRCAKTESVPIFRILLEQRLHAILERVDQDRLAAALAERVKQLEAQLALVGYPPGHFYSPIVDTGDPRVMEAVGTRTTAPWPSGVEVDTARMGALMRRLAERHARFPFPRHKADDFRFYFDNPFFGPHDASILFSMMLEFRPQRVIEVGCGHSSALLLDTNDRFFDGKLELTMIDPMLESVGSGWGDTGSARLVASRLQDVPLATFDDLEANDILFLDSSHVSKTGSDVNHYLFHILPRLKPGVLVHVHDILYPFEYPAEWVLDERRGWNEAYALRAFLQYNSGFEIVYWNNFVFHFLGEELAGLMPLCRENEGGSIWLLRR
ncbi:MAG: class I SAM-dependent methyltransferase [Acidobacteriota bacterium]